MVFFLNFPGKNIWVGSPFASPGYFPDAGIEPVSPALQVEFFTTEPPLKVPSNLPKFNENIFNVYNTLHLLL